MEIRSYKASDSDEVANLFHDSVHAIEESVYSKEQLEAWAPTPPDYNFWKQRLDVRQPFLAVEGETIVGFIELEDDGHIDCLYVHKDFQGKGIASCLLGHVIELARAKGIGELRVEASKLALPLFEKYAFKRQNTNAVERRGQLLTNYNLSLTIES